jgi:pimeloyl-ACP methyl ester carboxylesterase
MSLLDRLVFRPGRGRSRDLATLDFRFEDAWLEAEDGVRLHAFWLPDTSARPAERAVLLLHGNAGDATRRLPNADRLRRLGADVRLLDYRGYGRSEVRPTEAGIYADARAALDHLTKQRGIAAERIVVFGSSLGSAVAVDLARGRELPGLVVESGFPDMAAIARSFIGIGFQRWLGRKLASAAKDHRAALPAPVRPRRAGPRHPAGARPRPPRHGFRPQGLLHRRRRTPSRRGSCRR